MQKLNIFHSVPENLQDELFEKLLQTNNLLIERIVSKGHTSPEEGWYDQDKNEWVIVLSGEAILAFEDEEEIRLRPGGYINIPAHKKHRVKWTDPDTETIWLAVHYSP